MGAVFKLYPASLSPDFRYEPEDILDDARDVAFSTMVVIGELTDGSFWFSGNASIGEINLMLDRAKYRIVFGDPDE